MQPRGAQANKLIVTPKKHLFWFLKEGVQLNLTEPAVLDMYVQQVITRGRADDVKSLMKTIDLEQFKKALERIARFIPVEVRKFWEDFIGGHQ